MDVQIPREDLASAVLTFWEGSRVLLQDPDAVPPVMDAEMIAQASPGARGPWENSKGSGAPFCHPQEDHIINLRMMLRMTDRQPVPVYRQLHPTHSTMVCRCQPCVYFGYALQ